MGERARRAAIVAIAAAVAVPGVIALARTGAIILPGKRVERHGELVVTVPDTDGRKGRGGPGRNHGGSDSKDGCPGVSLTPADDLQDAIDARAGGTTYCLAAGTYTVGAPVRPHSGDRFVGAGPDATSVEASSAPAVFETTGTSGVSFRKLSISGADGSESCKPSCGRGISGGTNLYVSEVRLHDNDTAGIGGTDGGLRIVSSEIDHNGSEAMVGCCSAGVKSANGYSITGSLVHDNVGVGVWCDVGCAGAFEVVGNVITRNELGGVRYETSAGPAVIRDNTVTYNNLREEGGHGGIEVNSSRNVVIEANVLGGNGGAGIIVNGSRSPGLGDVRILQNTMAGDEVAGCDEGAVCKDS
jgi:hypothetical protein